jgi:hypothetical protein
MLGVAGAPEKDFDEAELVDVASALPSQRRDVKRR